MDPTDQRWYHRHPMLPFEYIIDRFKFIDHNEFLILCTGSREHGLKYQQLVHGLNIAGRILCDMHCIHSHFTVSLFIIATVSMAFATLAAYTLSCNSDTNGKHSDPSADVKLDRKSLSELAKNEPLSFQQIVVIAKSALASNYDKSKQGEAKAAQ
jgi:hypothetical protein